MANPNVFPRFLKAGAEPITVYPRFLVDSSNKAFISGRLVNAGIAGGIEQNVIHGRMALPDGIGGSMEQSAIRGRMISLSPVVGSMKEDP